MLTYCLAALFERRKEEEAEAVGGARMARQYFDRRLTHVLDKRDWLRERTVSQRA